MNLEELRKRSVKSIYGLATEDGTLLASGRDELFGCVFGRDTAITSILVMKAIRRGHTDEETRSNLLKIIKTSLQNMAALQGREVNRENGEEPGKFIHELRHDKFEHLLEATPPWFVGADGKLRNFDSVDSTPLNLLAIHEYWDLTRDREFLETMTPAVLRGLEWIKDYGDKDHDGILEYELPKDRQHGGLSVQSWTDSRESLQRRDGSMPPYPIAPVEVQGYAWKALRVWGREFGRPDLIEESNLLKQEFNRRFQFTDQGLTYFAQALDGNKKQIRTVTANPLLLLWASVTDEKGKPESIIEQKYVSDIVRRGMKADLFDPIAGLRTMSTKSETYNPKLDSYHNGSFWPMVNGMAWEGLTVFGFSREARSLRTASLYAYEYFGTPVEVYNIGRNGLLQRFESNGQTSCSEQAWSAAAIMLLASEMAPQSRGKLEIMDRAILATQLNRIYSQIMVRRPKLSWLKI